MLISVFDKEVPALPEYEGQELDAKFLGGKGYGLWWMQQQGVNVPPALIIPTTMCTAYMKAPKGTMKKIASQYANIEKFFKGQFGFMPLLSVRSGARVSMPGMMDTILNVGLDQTTEALWRKKLGDEAYTDSLHRLITMYGNVVYGINRHLLEKDDVLSALDVFQKETGHPFPTAKAQVIGAIEAVFKSWNNDRARFYRKMNNIPEEWGTAVVVQAMVFGNLNDNSCTGVLFTRNPDNGDGKVVGEYLVNAQGEDVVAGIRTPQDLSEMSNWNDTVAQEILDVSLKLESARKDVQDIEFTVQDGKLFILQTRNAKRSARAAVKIAVDMVTEGLLTPAEAVKRVTLKELDLAQQSILDPKFKDEPFATGIPACSGVVTGIAVLSAADAINCKEPCILVTQETTPDDIAGMNAAVGVLTMTGGATSHAAVVARGMNKPCVVGLGKDITSFVHGPTVLSFDGATGRVWLGKVPVIDGSSNKDVIAFKELCWKVFNKGQSVEITENPTGGTKMLRMDDKLTMPLEEAVTLVRQTLPNVETLIVDLTAPTEQETAYYSMFYEHIPDFSMLDTSAGPEAPLKCRLVKALEEVEGCEKIKLLAGNLIKETTLQKLSVASGLEDLILADEELIWVGQPTPAVDKVIGWKKAEGVKFSTIGKENHSSTSYVSEAQVLACLLR
jgi:pyruvate,phosphate dikinase